MCDMDVCIAGAAEVQSGGGSGKEGGAADDVEVNGVTGGAGVEGVSGDKAEGGGNGFLREGEEGASGVQGEMLEKGGRLEATEERLKCALAEVVRLTAELDGNTELLNECQVSGRK